MAGFKKIKKNKFDYVFSVKKADRSIEKFFGIEKNGAIKLFDPSSQKCNQQILPINASGPSYSVYFLDY